MNKVIKLTKGLDLPMEGMAAEEQKSVSRPDVFSICPDHYAGVKPKLLVREGDVVKAGSPLFCDKKFAEMNFASPVSGKVQSINRGERRKVLSITIEAEPTIQYEKYDVAVTTGDEVRALLLKAGVWSYIKQRPYDCIANPTKVPKAIWISSFDSAPLAPNYEYVLKGHESTLQAAVNALALIAPVYVGIRFGAKATDWRLLKNCTQVEFAGPHPAGNAGVQINHVCPVNKGETVYVIAPQDLLIIGRLMQKGIVDMSRLVALTGPLAVEKAYYKMLPGMPVSAILRSNILGGEAVRMVEGNVLSGHQVEMDESIEPGCNQLTVIPEGTEARDFMGWIMPRFQNFSANNAVMGKWLAKMGVKNFNVDARLLGGRRAIIASGEYDKVFPMDIYPEFLIKAMIAGNLDRMEALGAYEVSPEDFALCEYVCTSKMPLQAIVRQALDNMKNELE